MTTKLAGSIPADGVVFELTLQPVRGLDMVASDGYSTSGWEFNGQEVTKPRTGRFKLVRAGYCSDLNKVRSKITAPGQTPAAGQLREAFKEAYPNNDGNGPIGFPDPSWEGPGGGADFPVLIGDGEGWRSGFRWAGGDRGEGWRWLVEVE